MTVSNPFLAYLVAQGADPDALDRLRAELQQGGHLDPLALAAQVVTRGLAPAATVTEALRATHRAGAPPTSLDSQWGPYRGLRKLGQGAMGAVWEVEHQTTGAHYALKTISTDGVDGRLRFQREAKELSGLTHPNVVRVHAGELDSPTPFFVQELCSESLQDRLERGPLSILDVHRLVDDLIAGLSYIHEQGLLHRDLKPDNVLFDSEGQAKLADFGLLRNLGSASLRLTYSGEVMGTPAFMAPEQAMNSKTAGPAADVYALGAVVYAALAGHGPFSQSGLSPLALLIKIQEEAPPPLKRLRPGVPLPLLELCAGCLKKDPAQRPTLGELREGPPHSTSASKGIGLALLVVLLVGGLCVGAWFLLRSESPALTPEPAQEDAKRVARWDQLLEGGDAESLDALELWLYAEDPQDPERQRAIGVLEGTSPTPVLRPLLARLAFYTGKLERARRLAVDGRVTEVKQAVFATECMPELEQRIAALHASTSADSGFEDYSRELVEQAIAAAEAWSGVPDTPPYAEWKRLSAQTLATAVVALTQRRFRYDPSTAKLLDMLMKASPGTLAPCVQVANARFLQRVKESKHEEVLDVPPLEQLRTLPAVLAFAGASALVLHEPSAVLSEEQLRERAACGEFVLEIASSLPTYYADPKRQVFVRELLIRLHREVAYTELTANPDQDPKLLVSLQRSRELGEVSGFAGQYVYTQLMLGDTAGVQEYLNGHGKHTAKNEAQSLRLELALLAGDLDAAMELVNSFRTSHQDFRAASAHARYLVRGPSADDRVALEEVRESRIANRIPWRSAEATERLLKGEDVWWPGRKGR